MEISSLSPSARAQAETSRSSKVPPAFQAELTPAARAASSAAAAATSSPVSRFAGGAEVCGPLAAQ
jgi:hypothetical protein